MDKAIDFLIVKVSQLGDGVQAIVNDKLTILEKAKEAGLLSAEEYLTKKASLYATNARIPASQIKELLIGKLTG